MFRIFTLILPFAALVLASPSHSGQSGAGSDADLMAAFLRSDDGRLARAGQAAGATRLAKTLRSDERAAVLAAVTAAPWADDGWYLLLDLARIAGLPDRVSAAAAARAGLAVAHTLERARVLELEIPAGELLARRKAWQSLADNPSRWADIRVNALEISALITKALGPDADATVQPFDLIAIARDEEPEVRRAALELLPQPLSKEARQHVSSALRDDGDPVVAVAAAQALCAGLAQGDSKAELLLSAGPMGLARIRDLLENERLARAARTDAARCLLASDDKEDQDAAKRFAGTMPSYIRREITRQRRAFTR